MTALGLLLAGLGIVLIWTGIRGDDLRELLAGVFRSK